MAETPKRLGATTVVANTDTALYTVPSSTYAIVSSVAVCNRSASAATFRIAHVDGAIGVVANEDYVLYDVTIQPNDTYIATIGLTMQATHTLLVRSNSASVNFLVWGVEITV